MTRRPPGGNNQRRRRAGGGRGTRWRAAGLLALRVGLLAFFLSAVTLFGLVEAVAVPPAPDFVASTVYGRDDEVITRLYLEDRTPIPLAQMPEHLLQAVIAIEDYRFHRHAGVDFIGLGRALYSNFLRVARIDPARSIQGASTITQQLATALYLSRERTVSRKVREAVLAFKLERELTKDQILERYMNQVYFGHGAFGVEVAAQIYFGKSASAVSLAEGAMLAGLLRSPENYSPFRDPNLALRRRSFVLSRLAELGYITAAEAEGAKEEPLRLAELRPRLQVAPYFIDHVLAEIAATNPEVARGVYQSGYDIYTTLDLQMQEAAEQAMRTQLTRGAQDANGVTQPQAALVAVDPQNVYILAMVGGRSYRETQLNRATQAHRQPGSAFKPFLYAALVDRNYTTISQMMCSPATYPAGPGQPPYTPVDYGDDPYHDRPLTMREAVQISDNVVAVKWAHEVRPSTVISYARRMGIHSPMSPFLPLVLGSFEVYPLEIVAAYAPLANGGFRVEPMAVRKIVDRDGQVLRSDTPQIEPALPASTAYLVTDMLKTVMGPGGTGSHLGWTLGRPSAGKTGTTSESKDAWFIGFVPQVVCGVYVGYDEPASLWGPGGRLAGPIWAEFMRQGLRGVPATDFPRPPDVIEAAFCTETRQLANPTCPAATEVFREGTQPQATCPLWHGIFPPPPDGDEPDSNEPQGPGDSEGPAPPDGEGPDAPTWQEWYDLWRREGGSWPVGP